MLSRRGFISQVGTAAMGVGLGINCPEAKTQEQTLTIPGYYQLRKGTLPIYFEGKESVLCAIPVTIVQKTFEELLAKINQMAGENKWACSNNRGKEWVKSQGFYFIYAPPYVQKNGFWKTTIAIMAVSDHQLMKSSLKQYIY